MIGYVIGSINSTVVFIISLSVLILVHEWGHFITAKKLGINVERFALGFGPKLFSKVYNGTEYMINAIPLGGYVKMSGDERSECKGASDEFLSKPVGHRALVVLNGPVVNFVFAYLCFVLVFMMGFPGLSTKIEEVKVDGPAYQAGLRQNDEVISVNGKRTYGELSLDRILIGDQVEPLAITVLRNEQTLNVSIDPLIIEKSDLLGELASYRDIGVGFLGNIIGDVGPGYPANKAGLLRGDRVVEIDGKLINSWTSLQKTITESRSSEIEVVVLRDKKRIVKQIRPVVLIGKSAFEEITDDPKMILSKLTKEGYVDKDGVITEKFNALDSAAQLSLSEELIPLKENIYSIVRSSKNRKIGIGPQQELELYSFGFLESFTKASDELIFITAMTYKAIYKMITRTTSAKESVTGPVGIFYIVKGAAEEGFSHLLFIIGVISASLAIFNLLPVIPLDGGHIFLLGIEKLRGKPIPPKVDDFIARVGFSLIILLALFVFYSDFVRFGWIDNIKSFLGF